MYFKKRVIGALYIYLLFRWWPFKILFHYLQLIFREFNSFNLMRTVVEVKMEIARWKGRRKYILV